MLTFTPAELGPFGPGKDWLMVRRRDFIAGLGAAAWPIAARAQEAAGVRPTVTFSQQSGAVLKHAQTPTLDIAYEDSGPPTGFPVLLMHGGFYDPRCYDEVVPPLVAAGYRTIVPYLRGYGSTRFLSAATPRSGQQAALGRDLFELMDALGLARAMLVGFDWGGRAACIVAALWPERVRGLVSAGGYAIQNIDSSLMPAPPAQEYRFWYQYYFQTERGRAGLEANRRAFGKLLWQLVSPNWKFDDDTYERTAKSFDNPDFVDIVIHSYRHRFGYAPGDPALEPFEQQLPARPPIKVPTIVLQGEGDGVGVATREDTQARFFTGPYRRVLIPVIGHDVPQEAPKATAEAVLELMRITQ
jgi:pimeloyl-ACP methyl ester carboxylesterase